MAKGTEKVRRIMTQLGLLDHFRVKVDDRVISFVAVLCNTSKDRAELSIHQPMASWSTEKLLFLFGHPIEITPRHLLLQIFHGHPPGRRP